MSNCSICGEKLREFFDGEEMSMMYECPNKSQVWHEKKKKLKYLREEKKRINKEIKNLN